MIFAVYHLCRCQYCHFLDCLCKTFPDYIWRLFYNFIIPYDDIIWMKNLNETLTIWKNTLNAKQQQQHQQHQSGPLEFAAITDTTEMKRNANSLRGNPDLSIIHKNNEDMEHRGLQSIALTLFSIFTIFVSILVSFIPAFVDIWTNSTNTTNSTNSSFFFSVWFHFVFLFLLFPYDLLAFCDQWLLILPSCYETRILYSVTLKILMREQRKSSNL